MTDTFSSRAAAGKKPTSKRALYLVIAVCLAPVVISYVMYYGVRPDARTNYGELIEPQQPISNLKTKLLVRPERESGFLDVIKTWPQQDPRHQFADLGAFRGRWLMVRVGPAACDEKCQEQLWQMRQVRLTSGRERDRVERVWLVTDDKAPSLRADDQGTWVLALPAPGATDSKSLVPGQVYMVDPLGNLMMRFPTDADPAGMKKDLLKLLKASRIG